MTSPDRSVSVVVPVKNEEASVAPLLEEIHRALDGGPPFEVIYVDDGSDDGTAAALEAARRRFPRLRVLRHARPCGQSTAIRTGAKAARFAWIATLDGDGQNDPADIPALLGEALQAWQRQSGATGAPDVLIAGHRVDRHDGWLRRLSSKVANRVRGGLLRDRAPDTGCGLKVFGRDAFLALPFFDHMHRFLPALFLHHGGFVASVPVRHRPRTAGRSKYGVHNRLWVGIVDLFGVMWLQRRTTRADVIAGEDAADDARDARSA